MAIMDGWRGIRETWPAVLVAGGSFAIAQYLTSNFIGPELPDITASLASLCLTLFLRRWKPVRIFRFDTETSAEAAAQAPHRATASARSPGRGRRS